MAEKDMTMIGHLEEFRKRIIICLAFFILATLAAFPFCGVILRILKLPAAGLIQKLVFFSPAEAFTVYFKIAMLSGLVASVPVLLYQAWKFVSPAIDERFKRYCLTFVGFCSVMFIAGCAFAYFLLLPAALKFLLTFGSDQMEPLISAGRYISFVAAIILCTGLVFEMPVLSFILSRIGVLNYRFLRKRFKYAVIVILVTAAVITPTPDVFNMMLLAVPMLFLYEISIWVSFFAGRFYHCAKKI